MSRLVCVGQIVNVHGIKGMVKIKPFLENPMAVGSYGPLTDEAEKRNFKVRVISQKQGIVLAEIHGVTDRNSAEALKGTKLYIAREKLPEADNDEYYYCDLIGLNVTENGKPFGVVTAVQNYGAGDIIEIRLNNGKVFPFDFSEATFPVVDVKAEQMEIVLTDEIRKVLHED